MTDRSKTEKFGNAQASDYINLDSKSKAQAKQLREELRLNNEKVTFNFINWFLGYPAKIATLIGILFILTIILLFVFSVPELCADGSKQYKLFGIKVALSSNDARAYLFTALWTTIVGIASYFRGKVVRKKS